MTEQANVHKWDMDDILEKIHQKYLEECDESYWIAEKPDVTVALERLEENLGHRMSPVKALGVGGSGIVLKMKDQMFGELYRAMKFPRPVSGKISVISDMLEKEVQSLSKLRHPGIVKIIEHSIIENVSNYDNLPYYIMEFIEGSPSNIFLKSLDEQANVSKVIHELIKRTAETLEYLHRANVAHLDIKPDNILMDTDGNPVLIDLGTCKNITGDTRLTIVACTTVFADPRLIDRLEKDPTDDNRNRGNLPRNTIDPSWDLCSLGFTILAWLGINKNSGEVFEDPLIDKLDAYSRKFYLLLTGRLLSHCGLEWSYKRLGIDRKVLDEIKISDATTLCESIVRIRSNSGPILQVPELQESHSGSIQAAPGAHVPCTERLRTVLNHPLYKRLNSVSQLGFAYQIFPSAKHTRRDHSLGTYANTCRFIKTLYNDSSSPFFRQIIEIADIEAILLVSLLHDLGQFPLAHELEEIAPNVFDHVDITKSMIKGMHRTGKAGDRRIRFENLDVVFEQWNTTKEDLLKIIDARPRNMNSSIKEKLLRSLISGPIDADKMDYLYRDARHTDVPYPMGIDSDRLFRCMTTVLAKPTHGSESIVPTIGVYSKGRVPAEFVTLARYAMFSQVYWHHTVRAQKAMLARSVTSILAQLATKDGERELRADFIEFVTSLPDVLYPDGSTAIEQAALFEEAKTTPTVRNNYHVPDTDFMPTDAAVIGWFLAKLRDLQLPEYRLLENLLARKLCKRLWTLNKDMSPDLWTRIINQWDKLTPIQKQIACVNLEKKVRDHFDASDIKSITELSAEDAKKRLAIYTEGQIPWLLIDIPAQRASSEIPLHLVQETQQRRLREDWRAIGETYQSHIWESYGKNLRDVAGSIHVFCDPQFVNIVQENLEWDEGISTLQSVLEDASDT